MNIQEIFNPSLVIFTVGNMAAMGLELNVRKAINARNLKGGTLSYVICSFGELI